VRATTPVESAGSMLPLFYVQLVLMTCARAAVGMSTGTNIDLRSRLLASISAGLLQMLM
jgi:hypothetical protein